MKKIISLVLACGIMATALVGCGGSKTSAPAADAAQGDTASAAAPQKSTKAKYVMQIGHAQPEDNPRNISTLAFKKEVEEKTNGDVSVEIYPAGQLGTEKEMLESVKMGTLQAFRGGQFDFMPRLTIFTLPFLCENEKQIDALLNSDFAKKICDNSKNDNMMILGLGNAGGFRQFSNNKRPIKSPADMKGLKMRTTGMETINLTFKALGASTTSIAYSDLYMGLKTGVADGEENPWVNITGMKFYEVQKYFTVVNYQFHPDPFYVNQQWFEGLPEDYQKIIKDATKNMMKVNNESTVKKADEALQTIKNNAEVYTPTAEELQKFKDATKVVYDEYIKQGKMTKEELATMQDIVAKAK